MKKSILSLFVLAAVTVACKKNNAADAADVAVATEAAITYKVDTENSVIEWIGSKPAGQHTGTISLSNGEISLNNGVVESGNFTIDMNSITVTDLQPEDGKESLENHLKGTSEDKSSEDHFFNVTKFPEGTFEITAVSANEGINTIEGNLTLKGITKNVKFPASVTVDGDVLTISSEIFKINRVDWNVNYASKSLADDLKDKFINDDIELKITIKAAK